MELSHNQFLLMFLHKPEVYYPYVHLKYPRLLKSNPKPQLLQVWNERLVLNCVVNH